MHTEIPRNKSLTLYDPHPYWTTEEILEYERASADEFEFFLQLARQEEARQAFLDRIKRHLVPVRRHWRRPKFYYPGARQDKLILLRDRISDGWVNYDDFVRPGYEACVL